MEIANLPKSNFDYKLLLSLKFKYKQPLKKNK